MLIVLSEQQIVSGTLRLWGNWFQILSIVLKITFSPVVFRLHFPLHPSISDFNATTRRSMLRTSIARAKYRRELLRCEQNRATVPVRPYRFQFYGARGTLVANVPASIVRLVDRFQSSRSEPLIKTTIGTPTGRIGAHTPAAVSRRTNYLVNEIKLGWIKGRAVARTLGTIGEQGRSWRNHGERQRIRGDNRGTRDDAGIPLANAFISIRRGRVTCPPLRSISSTSFARSLLLSFLPSLLFPLFLFAVYPCTSLRSLSSFVPFFLSLSRSLSRPGLPFLSISFRVFLHLLSSSLSLDVPSSLPLWGPSSLYAILLSLRLFLFASARRRDATCGARNVSSPLPDGIEAYVFRLSESC